MPSFSGYRHIRQVQPSAGHWSPRGLATPPAEVIRKLWMSSQLLDARKLAPQDLFAGNKAVDHVVAIAADLDGLLHIGACMSLTKPLIAVAALRDQVMFR